MKHQNKKRKLIVKCLGVVILLTFIFTLSNLSAQESVNATGGNASGSGGSASYTVGQVFYQTRTGTNGSVAEGVQQPYEISVVTGIEEAKGINLSVSAYPNPTTDYLTLEIKGDVQTQYFASLYDINGKLLQEKKITDSQTKIVMSDLAPATYFLRLIQESRETQHLKPNKIDNKQFNVVKTFKIVKN